MSQRVGIVGVSESGKSSLARRLIAEARAAMPELPLYVRDPLGYEWEGASGYFNTSEELRALMQKYGTPAIVVVDEAVDFFRVGQVENHWILTRGRHEGLLPICIAHRVKMMAPNVRAQFSDLYVFNSAPEDADAMAGDYNVRELLDVSELPAGEFYHVRMVVGPDGKKRRTATLYDLFNDCQPVQKKPLDTSEKP